MDFPRSECLPSTLQNSGAASYRMRPRARQTVDLFLAHPLEGGRQGVAKSSPPDIDSTRITFAEMVQSHHYFRYLGGLSGLLVRPLVIQQWYSPDLFSDRTQLLSPPSLASQFADGRAPTNAGLQPPPGVPPLPGTAGLRAELRQRHAWTAQAAAALGPDPAAAEGAEPLDVAALQRAVQAAITRAPAPSAAPRPPRKPPPPSQRRVLMGHTKHHFFAGLPGGGSACLGFI